MSSSPIIAALIVAGGSGTRLQSDIPKQYLPLNGKAILAHSLERFAHNPAISLIITTIRPEDAALYEQSTSHIDHLLPPVHGGETRQASVYHGLKALEVHKPDYVLVHDAARPFLTDDLLDELIEAVQKKHAVIPALPMTDTVKQTDDAGIITSTLDRSRLWRVQTPQAFAYQLLLKAHEAAAGQNLPDDAAVMEAAGHSVSFIPGNEANVKITTQHDYHKAINSSADQHEFRTGYGIDVHAFDTSHQGPIRLCGIDVPHTCRLKGHSDADVGLHALTDALLATISAGDIGEHFPPSDDQWKGADSTVFLKEALRLLQEKGATPTHLDITLIGESPRISPHRDAIRQKVAALCAMDISRVSVKATTTEKLGFLGRNEGLMAQVVVTVKLMPDDQ